MKKYDIELDPNAVTYIERLHYEYEVLKDNVAYMVRHFSDDQKFLSGDMFREYQENEIQARINFERGMHEIFERFVPEKLKEHQISWSIDFKRNTLNITQFCECEVEL